MVQNNSNELATWPEYCFPKPQVRFLYFCNMSLAFEETCMRSNVLEANHDSEKCRYHVAKESTGNEEWGQEDCCPPLQTCCTSLGKLYREMFVFRKVWRALFSWNIRFENRFFTLLPANFTCRLPYLLHSIRRCQISIQPIPCK